MILPSILEDYDFWSALSKAEHRFLGLDYDGTLAPFKVERMDAVPLPGVLEALESIREQTNTTIAIISGRRANEVVQLLGDQGLTVVGSHGYEWRHPDGKLTPRAIELDLQRRLRDAHRQVEALGLADRVEQKAASIAFHTRGLPNDEAHRLEDRVNKLWSKDAAEVGLSCRSFDGGVELRAVGVDKGTVLVELIEQQPADTLIVYLGDDSTDEDAFRILRRFGGMGIKVGPLREPTSARAHLPDCEAVLEFLRRWASS
jgi:trehalose-phosphatase